MILNSDEYNGADADIDETDEVVEDVYFNYLIYAMVSIIELFIAIINIVYYTCNLQLYLIADSIIVLCIINIILIEYTYDIGIFNQMTLFILMFINTIIFGVVEFNMIIYDNTCNSFTHFLLIVLCVRAAIYSLGCIRFKVVGYPLRNDQPFRFVSSF